MNKLVLLVCTIFAICLSVYSLVGASNSGVELIVNQRTADYINGKIKPTLISKLSDISIPQQRFGRRGKIISSLGSLTIGSSRIFFTPKGTTVVLTSIIPSRNGKWGNRRNFSRRNHISVYVGGEPLATVNEGKPDFNISTCSVRDSIRVRVRSFRRWYSRPLRINLEDSVKAKICNEVRAALNEQVNALETSYPTNFSIGETLMLNTSLTNSPTFGRGFVKMPLVGLTSPLVSSAEIDELAGKYPSRKSSRWTRSHRHRSGRRRYRNRFGSRWYRNWNSRMVSFTFRPHTLNAALLAYHRANLFTQEFNLNQFDNYVQNMFKIENFALSDTSVCSNIADCAIKIKISTPQPPTVKLWRRISLNGTVVLEADLVNNKTSQRMNVLKLSAKSLFPVILQIRQNGNELKAIAQFQLNFNLQSISVDKSSLEKFTVTMANQLAVNITQQLIPKANAFLSTGVTIKQPGSFTYRDPTVRVRYRYLEVGANFAYNLPLIS